MVAKSDSTSRIRSASSIMASISFRSRFGLPLLIVAERVTGGEGPPQANAETRLNPLPHPCSAVLGAVGRIGVCLDMLRVVRKILKQVVSNMCWFCFGIVRPRTRCQLGDWLL